MKTRYRLLACLSIILWAINALCVKVAVESMSAYTFIFLQYALLVPLFLIVKKPDIEWTWFLGIACGWYLFNHLFLTLSLSLGMPAGFGIFLHKTCVLFSWIFAYLFFRDVPTVYQYGGVSISLIGLGQLIFIHFDEKISALSIIYMLLSAAFWGFGAACQKKNTHGHPLSVVVWAAGLSSLPMLLIIVMTNQWDTLLQDIKNLNWETTLCVLYTAIFGLLIAGICWIHAVKKEGLSKISPFILLGPPLTYFLSVLILNEHVSRDLVMAFCVIITGLAVAQFGKSKPGVKNSH